MTPSEQLIRFIRATAAERGLNTAALANEAGLPRGELKHVLSGASTLTVDMLVAVAGALNLGPEDLALLNAEPLDGEEETTPLAPVNHQKPAEGLPSLDPYGNHAEQILRLGFALGCDIHVVLHTDRLDESGVPQATIDQFPDLLPIKLDAAYHHHNDPRFLPEAVVLSLSFDALYSTTIPWEAFDQITLIPIEPELPEIDPHPQSGTHLRLIE